MKTKTVIALILGMLASTVSGQGGYMELLFSAHHDQAFIKMDSIRIMNCSLECDTILYWPDTVLRMDYTGVGDFMENNQGFCVLPCYPNPAVGHTRISIIIPEKGEVNITVSDAQGRAVSGMSRMMDRGIHTLHFSPGSHDVYFFTASWKGIRSSIKILNVPGSSHGSCTLTYIGSERYSPLINLKENSRKFAYNVGNKLLCIAYSDTLNSGFFASPENTQEYVFEFASNIPCPGVATVEHDGQIYHTVQVFSQCWLKENLNTGTMINGMQSQNDNGIVEKYCYDDNPANCEKYGGLYQWNEMMQYTTQEGAQGICPSGWHVPTDDDWQILEGAVDTRYGIGDTIWEGCWVIRGHDAGYHLKSIEGWDDDGNGSDRHGFTALPGGDRFSNGQYYLLGGFGYWWTSTQYSSMFSYYRLLYYYYPQVYRNSDYKKVCGLNVRCVKDR